MGNTEPATVADIQGFRCDLSVGLGALVETEYVLVFACAALPSMGLRVREGQSSQLWSLFPCRCQASS